ncbi:hypothetical protein KM043_010833 [Ampulex compressa]|nr:hypothetical protein KM043_010833 [Ampulex compressa]
MGNFQAVEKPFYHNAAHIIADYLLRAKLNPSGRGRVYREIFAWQTYFGRRRGKVWVPMEGKAFQGRRLDAPAILGVLKIPGRAKEEGCVEEKEEEEEEGVSIRPGKIR